MTLDSTIYVLTAEGASGTCGIVGVYSDREAAKAAGRLILPETDGYHSLVVRSMKLDHTYQDQFPYGNGRINYIDAQIQGVDVTESAGGFNSPSGGSGK